MISRIPIPIVLLALLGCGGDQARPGLDRTAEVAIPAGPAAPPRPVAPLSTSRVTSRRPTLRWELAKGTTGALVELCRDRACSEPLLSKAVDGVETRPEEDLPPGLVYFRLRGLRSGTAGSSASPTWSFRVGGHETEVDSSWLVGHDLDGDGFSDAVLTSDAVLLGGPSGLDLSRSSPLRRPTDGPVLYDALVLVGDVDGDGYSDALYGDPGCPPYSRDRPPCAEGHVYLFLGSSDGLGSEPRTTLTAPGGRDTDFGMMMASAGDVHGDGYADVLVGESTGAVHLYSGSPQGLQPTARPLWEPGPDGGVVAVAAAGDVNGDGLADVVVALSREVRRDGELWHRIEARLFLGAPEGPRLAPARIEPPGGRREGFSTAALAAGDFDGDGYADLAVGATEDPPTDDGMPGPGRVYVYRGGPGGLGAEPVAILTGADGPRGAFGSPLAAPADLNGDGRDDLVAVASCAVFDRAGSSCTASRAYVFLGSADGLEASPRAALSPPRKNMSVPGSFLDAPGDVDGDGLADFLFGANLFRGRAASIETLSPEALEAP